MTPQQKATLIAGLAAAVSAFIVWLLLDNSLVTSIVYAVLIGIVAGGVTWWQKGNRA